MIPPSGLGGPSRGTAWRRRCSVLVSPKASSSSGTGGVRRGTGFSCEAMTTNRAAAAATSFSRVWARPPPLISHGPGAIWSAPSIAMSSSAARRRTPRSSRRRWPPGPSPRRSRRSGSGGHEPRAPESTERPSTRCPGRPASRPPPSRRRTSRPRAFPPRQSPAPDYITGRVHGRKEHVIVVREDRRAPPRCGSGCGTMATAIGASAPVAGSDGCRVRT